MPVLNSMNITRPAAIAISVLVVWWTMTLSIMTWVNTGVLSPISWMNSEANSTSRQMRLCRSSSLPNQRKPKRAAAAAPSPVSVPCDADSCRTRIRLGSNCPENCASGVFAGVCDPATK